MQLGDSSIAIGGDDWNVVRTKKVAEAGNKQVHQVFEELTGMPMKAQGEAFNNPFKGTTAGDAAVAIGVAALLRERCPLLLVRGHLHQAWVLLHLV